MIEKLKINTTYYEQSRIYPFYTREWCINLNGDGTYDTVKAQRRGVTSNAEGSWCYTKEEAVQNSIDYYLEFFHEKNMTDKADIYQNFQKDMGEWLKNHSPEYFL